MIDRKELTEKRDAEVAKELRDAIKAGVMTMHDIRELYNAAARNSCVECMAVIDTHTNLVDREVAFSAAQAAIAYYQTPAFSYLLENHLQFLKMYDQYEDLIKQVCESPEEGGHYLHMLLEHHKRLFSFQIDELLAIAKNQSCINLLEYLRSINEGRYVLTPIYDDEFTDAYFSSEQEHFSEAEQAINDIAFHMFGSEFDIYDTKAEPPSPHSHIGYTNKDGMTYRGTLVIDKTSNEIAGIINHIKDAYESYNDMVSDVVYLHNNPVARRLP